jgi:hypothetical protein
LLNNILSGKFEFKKGNTLASLSEAILANFDNFFPHALKNTPIQVFTNHSPAVGGNTDLMLIGLLSLPSDVYIKTVKVFSSKLLPFFKMHYFNTAAGGYHINKKAVVISLYSRL